PARRQLAQDEAGIPLAGDGPDGDPEHQVLGIGAVLVGAAAVLAPTRRVLPAIAKVEQGGETLVGLEKDGGAAPAVAAVRSAARHVLLAAEAHAAAAAVTGLDEDVDLVDEHRRGGAGGGGAPIGRLGGSGSGAGRPDGGPPAHVAEGRTLTNRRPARWSKRTIPSVLANSVKSTPSPTLVPGRKRVPRWRTRIEPAVTCWPPNRFTPSILAWLSRPSRELPPPFLCAMVSVSVVIDSAAGVDARDPDGGVRLPVPLAARVVLSALELEDHDLGAAPGAHHLADDPGAGQ